MISEIDKEAMQALESAEGPSASHTLDAAHRFAKSVCELFIGDAYWSVHDLDGAKEFFETIDYTPPPEAVTSELDEQYIADRF